MLCNASEAARNLQWGADNRPRVLPKGTAWGGVRRFLDGTLQQERDGRADPGGWFSFRPSILIKPEDSPPRFFVPTHALAILAVSAAALRPLCPYFATAVTAVTAAVVSSFSPPPPVTMPVKPWRASEVMT